MSHQISKNIKQKSLLSNYQLSTINYLTENEIPHNLWNSQIHHLFKKVKLQKGQIIENMSNQTYQEFIEMDLSGPNEEGTGRYRFNEIGKIRFSIIQKQQSSTKLTNFQDSGVHSFSISSIQQILQNFLHIPVQYLQTPLHLSKKYTLINSYEGVQYSIQKDKLNQLEVWSLLDFGIQYKENYQLASFGKKHQKKQSSNENSIPQKKNIFLFLIQADMIQNGNEIDGRAVGNGVAFVTFKRSDFNLQKSKGKENICYTLPILIHECLHTLGFDHCSAWQCLMNSVTNEEFWLCPSCLRKIKTELSDEDVQAWYNKIVETLKQIKQKSLINYGNDSIIRILKPLINTNSPQKSSKFLTMLEKGQQILQSFLKH